MNKKNNTAVIVTMIIGIAILFVTKAIPAFLGFILAMKDYKVFSGFSGSPWIGFQNFKTLFSSFNFLRTLSHTIVLNVITLVFTFILSWLFVQSLAGKSKRQALIFTAIYALAAIIPSIIKSGSIIFALGFKSGNFFYLIYPLTEALKWAGFASIAAFFMTGENNTSKKKSVAIASIAVLAIASRLISSDTETANLLLNPMIYDRADLLDSFSFRSSFMNMQIGLSSALWCVKFIVELLTAAAAGIGIVLIIKKLNTQPSGNPAGKNGSIVLNIVISAVIIIATVLSLIPKSNVSLEMSSLNIPYNIMLLFAAVIVSIISCVLAAVFAYPFTSGKTSVRLVYLAVLIFSLYGVYEMQRYLVYRSLGIINTLLPVLLCGFMPIWMIAAFAIYIYSTKSVPGSGGYVKKIVPVAIMLASINFSIMWGGYMPSLIYSSQPNLFTFPLILKNIMAQGQQSLLLNLFIVLPILAVWGVSIFVAGKVHSSSAKEGI